MDGGVLTTVNRGWCQRQKNKTQESLRKRNKYNTVEFLNAWKQSKAKHYYGVKVQTVNMEIKAVNKSDMRSYQ